MCKAPGDFLTLIFKETKYIGENDGLYSQQQNSWLKILCRKHFRWLSSGKKGSSSAFRIKTAWVWTMSFTNYNEKTISILSVEQTGTDLLRSRGLTPKASELSLCLMQWFAPHLAALCILSFHEGEVHFALHGRREEQSKCCRSPVKAR